GHRRSRGVRPARVISRLPQASVVDVERRHRTGIPPTVRASPARDRLADLVAALARSRPAADASAFQGLRLPSHTDTSGHVADLRDRDAANVARTLSDRAAAVAE